MKLKTSVRLLKMVAFLMTYEPQINCANGCSNNLDNGSRLLLQNGLILFLIHPYFTRIVTRPNSETCTSYHLKIRILVLPCFFLSLASLTLLFLIWYFICYRCRKFWSNDCVSVCIAVCLCVCVVFSLFPTKISNFKIIYFVTTVTIL